MYSSLKQFELTDLNNEDIIISKKSSRATFFKSLRTKIKIGIVVRKRLFLRAQILIVSVNNLFHLITYLFLIALFIIFWYTIHSSK